MLEIKINETEIWDPIKREFFKIKPQTLQLEHSLISLQKWEAIHKKPFLHTNFTNKEFLSYIKCMTINKVDNKVYNVLQRKDFQEIIDYMSDSKTATTVKNRNKKRNRDIITAEVLYAQMAMSGVSFECRKWHLSQLLTLLNTVGAMMEPPKKMSKSEIYAQQRAINAKNRAKYHTRG